jgi:hypothetical protein
MNIIIKPIYNNKSLLLIKEVFININKLKEFMSNNIKVSPFINLLSYLMSAFYKFIT